MNSRLFDLSGKVAIVTGGRRGIGRAIALGLAKAGADVAVCDLVVEDGELQAVAEQVQRVGRRSLAIQTDVSQKTEVDNMVQKVKQQFGTIDILVSNAGIGGAMKRAEDVTKEDWDQIININLTGAFLCTQAAGKVMIEQKRGKIIIISSIFGAVSNPRFMPYSVTKAGLTQLTKSLARDWVRYNIQVNAIGPGMIDTEMARGLRGSQAVFDELMRRIPMGRMGTPEEIAGAAIFLASEESNYMTGQTLYVDGGWLSSSR